MLEAAVEDIVYADGSFTVAGSPESTGLVAEGGRGGALPQALRADVRTGPRSHRLLRSSRRQLRLRRQRGRRRGGYGDRKGEDPRLRVGGRLRRGYQSGIVDGQIHGGIAQGIGQALYEQVSHDESGQVPSASFAAYLLPSAMEVPRLTPGQHRVALRHPARGARSRRVRNVGIAARNRQRSRGRARSIRRTGRPDPAAPRRGVGTVTSRVIPTNSAGSNSGIVGAALPTLGWIPSLYGAVRSMSHARSFR